MATLGVKTFELTRGSEKDYGSVVDLPEAATQTFFKGDPVKIDTAGRVLLGVDTEALYGIALQDSSGTTDALVAVMPLQTDQIWSVSVSNAGAGTATARTDVGVECSYIKSTSTVGDDTLKTVIDIGDTTTPAFVIIGLDQRDTLADTNGRVLVHALPGTVSTGGIRSLSI